MRVLLCALLLGAMMFGSAQPANAQVADDCGLLTLRGINLGQSLLLISQKLDFKLPAGWGGVGGTWENEDVPPLAGFFFHRFSSAYAGETKYFHDTVLTLPGFIHMIARAGWENRGPTGGFCVTPGPAEEYEVVTGPSPLTASTGHETKVPMKVVQAKPDWLK